MGSDYSNTLKKTLSAEGTAPRLEHTGDISVMGFRQKFVDAYYKKKGLPTKNTANLTNKERSTIAHEEFYKNPGLDKLPKEIVPILFDYGFNSGAGMAVKALQSVVGAKVDGIIGNDTVMRVDDAVRKMGADGLISELVDARQAHMQYLSRRAPARFRGDFRGLIDRIEDYRPSGFGEVVDLGGQ